MILMPLFFLIKKMYLTFIYKIKFCNIKKKKNLGQNFFKRIKKYFNCLIMDLSLCESAHSGPWIFYYWFLQFVVHAKVETSEPKQKCFFFTFTPLIMIEPREKYEPIMNLFLNNKKTYLIYSSENCKIILCLKKALRPLARAEKVA